MTRHCRHREGEPEGAVELVRGSCGSCWERARADVAALSEKPPSPSRHFRASGYFGLDLAVEIQGLVRREERGLELSSVLGWGQISAAVAALSGPGYYCSGSDTVVVLCSTMGPQVDPRERVSGQVRGSFCMGEIPRTSSPISAGQMDDSIRLPSPGLEVGRGQGVSTAPRTRPAWSLL